MLGIREPQRHSQDPPPSLLQGTGVCCLRRRSQRAPAVRYLLHRGCARASRTLKPLGRASLPLLPQQHPWAAPNEKGRVGELAKPMPSPSAWEKNGYFVRMYFIKKINKPLVFLLHPFVVPMLAPGRGVCSAFRHWAFVHAKQSCKLGRRMGPCDGLGAGSAFPCGAPGPLVASRGCYQGCHLGFLLRRAGWWRALACCRPWRERLPTPVSINRSELTFSAVASQTSSLHPGAKFPLSVEDLHCSVCAVGHHELCPCPTSL